MVNIVLETNNTRPRLLEQTLRTLQYCTPEDQYTLTVVCDCPPTFGGLPLNMGNTSVISLTPPCNVTGRLKNLGAYWSEKQFGRGEWLLFIDDDVAFLPGWLEQMTRAMSLIKRVWLLGGNRHPYHGVNETYPTYDPNWRTYIEVTDAVAGYSMLMRWGTFDEYGPFDAHAKGIAQSEDYAFARRIVKDGGKAGYIHPPVLYHTGITNSSGQPATGAEKIERKEGILYL